VASFEGVRLLGGQGLGSPGAVERKPSQHRRKQVALYKWFGDVPLVVSTPKTDESSSERRVL
jgi:hypothetical protein